MPPVNGSFVAEMKRVSRLAIVAAISAAFLAVPLGALCSVCCLPGAGLAMSAPMPCCDGTCAPTITSARPDKPMVTTARAKLDPPLSAGVLLPDPIQPPVAWDRVAATAYFSPPESPPTSPAVLRL